MSGCAEHKTGLDTQKLEIIDSVRRAYLNYRVKTTIFGDICSGMKSDCNAEHAGRALLCFTVILWYSFIDGKHGDHNVSCHPMTVTLSPGCSLLHQERTASLDRGQGPLHLWMLSLNALDFWLTDRIAEGGRVDLLVLRNHSNSCVWGYPVVCFFCKSSNYKWL